MRVLFALTVAIWSAACSRNGREAVLTQEAASPVGPYSQAIKVNGTLYVSGQIALRGDGSLDTSSIRSECRQVMENVKAIVESAGCEMEQVCRATIFTTRLSEFKSINEVYGSYFRSSPPARETVEVAALPKGARLEISVIATY